jgi:hypothetical protein
MVLDGALPVKMATETPQPRRWHKRAPMLMELSRRSEVREMMDLLGYAMDACTWL